MCGMFQSIVGERWEILCSWLPYTTSPHPPVSVTEDVADDVGQLGGGRHVEEDGDQEDGQHQGGGRQGGRDSQLFVRDLGQLVLVPEVTTS